MQAEGLVPWFEFPQRRNADTRIAFGHWSTLGQVHNDQLVSLDTGCLWGGSLTAWRIEDDHFIAIDCPGAQTPGT